jgi:hypothetical protein
MSECTAIFTNAGMQAVDARPVSTNNFESDRSNPIDRYIFFTISSNKPELKLEPM